LLLVFESVRVWAISGRSWWLAIAVLSLAIFAPAVDIVFGPAVRAATICADIIVLIVTLQKTVQTARSSQELSVEAKYTSLLLYTGKHHKYF
ncbi:hypothetical protein K474DRAFT_1587717, partial [Panus rudis PR-1116 ss-1]